MQRLSKFVPAVFMLAAVCFVLAACSESPVAPAATDIRGISSAVEVDGSIKVTNNANAGSGSFRAAIEAANASASITSIKFDKGLGAIVLSSPVTFSGTQALDINGSVNVISGASLGAGQDAFVANGGGDLTVRRLTVRNAPGVGIKVLVPSTETGIVAVTFQDVITRDNGLHGALINDQSGYLIDPSSTSQDGSDASLRIRISGSTFEDNGFTLIDQDGLRVNEGGIGGIDAVITHTQVLGNGGDGIELDERGVGSAVFTVEHSQLNRNGAFTAADFDDGIDVDEAGDGDIDARFNQVVVNDNFEQGVDLNENHAGDLRVFMNKVEASGNDQEGVEFEEDDDFAGGGDIIALLQSVTTLRNGESGGADAGLKIREKGVGNVVAHIIKPVSSDNVGLAGNKLVGILVREDAAGDLTATIENAVAVGNSGDGIGFDENAAGNLAGDVFRATSSDNGGAGVAADQASTGTGLLRIRDLTAAGNVDGAVKSNAGVTVQYLD